MAADDPKSLDDLNLSAEERKQLAAREQAQLEALASEVAGRFDPERLRRVSASTAGQVQKLDSATRSRMEQELGGNFADVRIVRGAFADRVTQRHRADAVTVGRTGLVLLRETPRTNPNTAEGRAVLAHELTHVKQAQSGLNFALEQGGHGAAHEQAAEHAEAKSLAKDKHGHGKKAPADPEKRREKILERVLSKVAEARRLDADLLGFDDR
jgi:hypothetical protein